MLSKLHLILCGAALALAASLSAVAQAPAGVPEAAPAAEAENDEFVNLVKSIDWKTEAPGSLGKVATLDFPAGYRFTGTAGTVKLMEAFGNLTSGSELGYVSPLDMGWFAVFEFDDVGYVKDDEKDKLDPDGILEQLKEGQQQANKQLAERGMSTLEVLGWQTPPFYNPATNNLEWAIRLRSQGGGESINYKTKLLGRRGVMDVVLVCSEEELPAVIPEYQKLLTGFSYKKEESYASFSSGDKIAKYGLTGLIVGGGLLVAAKSGLLGKMLKPIIIGVIAIGAFLKRIFVGKTKDSI
jgi:uncharacterized membrane-anchored protein